MSLLIGLMRLYLFESLLLLNSAFLHLDQGVAGQLAIALVVGLGFDGAIGPCDPRHEGCRVRTGILPLDIAVDPSPVFLQAEPSVVIDVSCNEPAADFLPRLASELLQAGQLQRLLGCYPQRWVELEHSEDQVLDVLVAVAQVALQAALLHFYLREDWRCEWTVHRIETIYRGHACKLNDLFELVKRGAARKDGFSSDQFSDDAAETPHIGGFAVVLRAE